MAAGLPISLVAQPDYQARSQSVRELYGTVDGPRAWAIARGLKIDYLYVDDVERGAYSAARIRSSTDDTELFHLASAAATSPSTSADAPYRWRV